MFSSKPARRIQFGSCSLSARTLKSSRSASNSTTWYVTRWTYCFRSSSGHGSLVSGCQSRGGIEPGAQQEQCRSRLFRYTSEIDCSSWSSMFFFVLNHYFLAGDTGLVWVYLYVHDEFSRERFWVFYGQRAASRHICR